MGQDCGSWLPPQQLHSLSPKLNSSVAPLSAQQDAVSAFMKGGIDMISHSGTFPVFAQLHRSHVGQGNEPQHWFYGLPRFKETFMPARKPSLEELFPGSLVVDRLESVLPGPESAQKRFLVFDQSGDQTTLIFTSGIGKPFRRPTSWSPRPEGAYDVKGGILGIKEDLNLDQGVILKESGEHNPLDVQSEMHEDTEELNALLYSDDESDYSDDDEVTSSDHSPSTISSHDNQEASVGSTEGPGSNVGPVKKRKMLDGHNDKPLSVLDTSSSAKRNKLRFQDESDAESSCGNGGNSASMEIFLSSSNKRMKREKICETVSLIRSIVPDGEGEDPISILDKAIDYLKSLKVKAEALGLDAL